MPDLLDIIRPWPIISTVVTELGFSDVLNLSRTSVECRILLHDFPFSSIDIANASGRDQQRSSGLVRAALYIGQHETPHWRALKAKAQMLCTDPDHKKGLRPKPCRHCSMPICEACIVRVWTSSPRFSSSPCYVAHKNTKKPFSSSRNHFTPAPKPTAPAPAAFAATAGSPERRENACRSASISARPPTSLNLPKQLPSASPPPPLQTSPPRSHLPFPSPYPQTSAPALLATVGSAPTASLPNATTRPRTRRPTPAVSATDVMHHVVSVANGAKYVSGAISLCSLDW